MRLEYEDIKNKHSGTSCYVTLHGPSLTPHIKAIEEEQKDKKAMRISVNDWFHFFDTSPDYWVFSHSQTTIESCLLNSGTWKHFKYPPRIMNEVKVPVLFADSVDLTDYGLIEAELECDYLGYDQRHFQGDRCVEILKNFRNHYQKHGDYDFKDYGNNPVMWAPPRMPAWGFGNGVCCERIEDRLTIQEELQKISGHNEHYSTGDTVALHAIAFAIIMGFNPIKIVGMDLDYRKGYAGKKDGDTKTPMANDDWIKLEANLLNDLKILHESAKMLGTTIEDLSDNRFNIF